MTTPSTTQDGLTEAQNNYENDKPRLRTRKAALLNLLQDGSWHPNYELAEVGGLSFNSYLYQLRLDGWKITSRRVRGGVWEQRLAGRNEPPFRRIGLTGPQQRVMDEVAVAVRKVYGDEGLTRVQSELDPWLTHSFDEV